MQDRFKPVSKQQIQRFEKEIKPDRRKSESEDSSRKLQK